MVASGRVDIAAVATHERARALLLALVVATAVLLGGETAQGRTPVAGIPAIPVQQTMVATADPSTMALDLFRATNEERSQAGLPRLRWDEGLRAVAATRVGQMVDEGYFGHEDPRGETAYTTLLAAVGYKFAQAGENLARNNYAVGETVAESQRALMASPPHRENMLAPHYDRAGIAAVRDEDGTWVYAIIFAGG